MTDSELHEFTTLIETTARPYVVKLEAVSDTEMDYLDVLRSFHGAEIRVRPLQTRQRQSAVLRIPPCIPKVTWIVGQLLGLGSFAISRHTGRVRHMHK